MTPSARDSLHVPPATLLALAQRAEARGDDALSDECWIALGWRRWEPNVTHWVNPFGEFPYAPRPDLVHSLDAVEEVPGRIVCVDLAGDGDNRRAIAEARDGTRWYSIAPTECLARLAAKLRALAAQKESDGG